jgi:hypothetical protein
MSTEKRIYTHQAADPFKRTLDRLAKVEARAQKRFGYAGTIGGRALTTKYATDLAAIIKRERETRHGNKAPEIWEKLDGVSDLGLALDMIALGLNTRFERNRTRMKWHHNLGVHLGFDDDGGRSQSGPGCGPKTF